MIKKLTVTILVLLFSSSLYAEFQMERVICTTKKISNCGAYIYNTKTGEVYFCDSKECKEVETPIEIFIEEEEEESGSLIPKKPKKKESKIPKKPKKKESKIPKKPEKKESKTDECKDSKIPKKGCT
jgi:hydroxymethylpyrimidine pyrophosphatase-like HAD family hydrolase